MRGGDGKYHIGGSKFEMNIGSRAQVWHRTAHKTAGGLTKAHLMMNKHGRIVSRKKHKTAKREKRLEKHGFFAQKGKFGVVHSSSKRKTRRKRRRTKRKH